MDYDITSPVGTSEIGEGLLVMALNGFANVVNVSGWDFETTFEGQNIRIEVKCARPSDVEGRWNFHLTNTQRRMMSDGTGADAVWLVCLAPNRKRLLQYLIPSAEITSNRITLSMKTANRFVKWLVEDFNDMKKILKEINQRKLKLNES